jgi:hypothetical protein
VGHQTPTHKPLKKPEPQKPNEPEESSIIPKGNRGIPELISIPSKIEIEGTSVLDANHPLDSEAHSYVKIEDLFEPEVILTPGPIIEGTPAEVPDESQSHSEEMNTIIQDLLNLSKTQESPPNIETQKIHQTLERAPDHRVELFFGTHKHIKIFEEPLDPAKKSPQETGKINFSVKKREITIVKTVPSIKTAEPAPSQHPFIDMGIQNDVKESLEFPSGIIQGPVELMTGESTEPIIVESNNLPELLENHSEEPQLMKTENSFPMISPVLMGDLQKPVFPDEKFNARWIIEALRLGIVPHHQVEQFSCGREEEIHRIENWLQSNFGCMMLSGAYGAGKSHMLNLTISKALKQGWAVAFVEIDPEETPFNQPKKIYRQIIRSFKYEMGNKQYLFEDFIADICSTKDHEHFKKMCKHPIFGSLISEWTLESNKTVDAQEFTNEDLQNWIAGDEIPNKKLPSLDNFQTMGNLYCNILSGIGWGVRNILGLKGLLILIDEGESIDKSWYSLAQFVKAENFLKGLILMANNDANLKKEAEALETSQFNDLFDFSKHYGQLTGLQYGGRKNQIVPFIWGSESNVKLLFSFVPEIIPFVFYNILKDDDICEQIQFIELSELNEDNFNELSKKIQTIYEIAYNFSSPDNFESILAKDKTRRFVKSVVEALDIMRFNPTTYREEFHLLEKAENCGDVNVLKSL